MTRFEAQFLARSNPALQAALEAFEPVYVAYKCGSLSYDNYMKTDLWVPVVRELSKIESKYEDFFFAWRGGKG